MDVVTVFGGSGFVGRYLVSELARTGVRIRVAVRRPDRAGFLRPMGDVGQITPVAANVRDDVSVRAAVTGVDTVFNLVGILARTGPQTFQSVHVGGARRVAEAASEAGARTLVHVSAIGADPASASFYASTKGAAESAVRESFPGAVVVRPSLVIGAEDDFFNRFAVLARLLPALPLIGGGSTRFQPVYVRDLARALSTVGSFSEQPHALFEIGGPRVFTFRELMEILLEEIGRKRLLVPIPFALASFKAALIDWLPGAPITRDQVRLLRHDNVVSGEHPGLAELGIEPVSLEGVVPGYLRRYRRGVWSGPV